MGFKLPKWLRPPSRINSVNDLVRQSAGLTELLGLVRDWLNNPLDLHKAQAVREKMQELGL